MEKTTIQEYVKEARSVLTTINDGHMGANVSHDRVRNLLAMAETELRFLDLEKAETIAFMLKDVIIALGANVEAIKLATAQAKVASDEQGKQTRSMIIWTKVMAVAVAAQVLVGGIQATIYYQQLQLAKSNSITK